MLATMLVLAMFQGSLESPLQTPLSHAPFRLCQIQWEPVPMAYGQSLPRTQPPLQEYRIWESNLELWQNTLQPAKMVPLIPEEAVQINKERRSRSFVDLPKPAHRPWQIAFKYPWLDDSNIGSLLHYKIVHSPSSRSPYYEAVVCAMPNINCKAKTVEELERLLLKSYAEYLTRLNELPNGLDELENEDRLHPSIRGGYDKLHHLLDF